VPISAALRQSHTIKVATVASCWQRMGDLISLGFEAHTSHTRSELLTTCAIWPVDLNYQSPNHKLLQKTILITKHIYCI